MPRFTETYWREFALTIHAENLPDAEHRAWSILTKFPDGTGMLKSVTPQDGPLEPGFVLHAARDNGD